VEAAVKLARMATGARIIIVMQGSFHGRTHQTMAMTTSKYIYRYNYQPLPGGVFVTPFPYSYYYGWNDAETYPFVCASSTRCFHSQSAPDETAAIIIEPVLGRRWLRAGAGSLSPGAAPHL
jgi:4-aminobutyrate aminotransferase